jgi:predicted transcriptional regulator
MSPELTRMSKTPPHQDLSRRERQIMDVLYRRGTATAAEVHAGLPDPPSQTAVRTLLRILEEKGQVTHDADGVRHVYRPTTPREDARTNMMEHLVRTFFNGSRAQAMAALLGDYDEADITDAELARLQTMIAAARRKKS